MLRKLYHRLRAQWRRKKFEREMEAEMRFHLEMETAKNVGRGMSEEEARLAARRCFGGIEQVKEAYRDVSRFRWIEDFWQDLRYGMRTLLKHPGFSTVVVLTLALGIGVNTAFFALFDLYFRPLPIKDPDMVVKLEYRGMRRPPTFPDYLYFRDHTQVFSSLIAYSGETWTIVGRQGDSEPQDRVVARYVSGNFFSMLGAKTVLGRTFTPEEDSVPAKEPVVVLNYRLWKKQFNADPNILGQTVRLNAKNCVVIGVTTPDFVGLGLPLPDIWLPLMMLVEVQGADKNWYESREDSWLEVAGRLRPGRTLEEGVAEMNLLLGQLARAYPEFFNAQAGIRVSPLSMLSGGDFVMFITIMTATTTVLMIACSTMANLMFARGIARRREIGVRLSLGASRWRVIRQLLTESSLLSCLGGGIGLLMAWWSLKMVLATTLISNVPKLRPDAGAIVLHLNPDLWVLIYVFLLSLLAGITFGLMPALHVTRTNLITQIKDEKTAFGGTVTRPRLGNWLVATQVALSMALLIPAGLLVRSVIGTRTINPGFETRNVLRVEIDKQPMRDERVLTSEYEPFRKALLARLETLPSVQSVSQAFGVPFRGTWNVSSRAERENVSVAGQARTAYTNEVAPNYFETMGIPIVRGRVFTKEEARSKARVVLVTESTARNLWPDQEPLGQCLSIIKDKAAAEVIGVVRDTQSVELGKIDSLFVYKPLMPQRWSVILLRASHDAGEIQPLVRSAARGLDPSFLIRTNTVEDDIASSGQINFSRFALKVTSLLGLLALFLTAVGLYGVIAYSVAQRRHEIGIRMALGATNKDVLMLVIRQGLCFVAIGMVIGVAGGMAVSRTLSGLLFGLSPFNPIVYVSMLLSLMTVASTAMYLPARRAVSVDPLVALKEE